MLCIRSQTQQLRLLFSCGILFYFVTLYFLRFVRAISITLQFFFTLLTLFAAHSNLSAQLVLLKRNYNEVDKQNRSYVDTLYRIKKVLSVILHIFLSYVETASKICSHSKLNFRPLSIALLYCMLNYCRVT